MGASKKDVEATRAERKAKKRKAEDAIPDLPGDDEVAVSQEPKQKSSKKRKRGEAAENESGEGGTVQKVKKVKKDKKEKKSLGEDANGEKEGQGNAPDADGENKKLKKFKKSKKAAESTVKEQGVSVEAGEEFNSGALVPDSEGQPRKSKKERKAEKKAAEALLKSTEEKGTSEETSAVTGEVDVVDGGSQTESTKAKKNNRNRDKKRKAAATGEEMADGKPARFIVFIGNLPFTATTSSIEKHFAAVHPKSIRHLTKKEDSSKSRGCAFIEFDGYDHMKTCLKLFHHSNFDDGLSAPRKINVELTAGGGGKTKHRTEKIEEKNQKLNEQRIRRMHEEEKAKLVKRDAAIDHNAVHPSRRARVPDVS